MYLVPASGIRVKGEGITFGVNVSFLHPSFPLYWANVED